jgi:hypothetical protein
MASVDEWLALAHRVLGLGLKFQAIYVPVRGPRSSSVHICGLSIVARSVSNLRGILTLIDVGLVTEARKLLRCSLEDFYFLEGLIREGPSLVQKMCDEDEAQRTSRGQLILERQMKVDIDIQNNLRGFLRGQKQQGKRGRSGTLEPKMVAGAGVLRDSYLLYKQLSADASHTTVTALNRHIKAGADGKVRRFVFSPMPTPEELIDTLLWTSNLALGTYVAGSQLVDNAALNAEASGLLKEYAELIKVG